MPNMPIQSSNINSHEVNCACTACLPKSAGMSPNKWSDDDDFSTITAFYGRNI